MKAQLATRGAALLCLWPIVATSAFASTSPSSTATLPFRHQHQPSVQPKYHRHDTSQRYHNRINRRNPSRLHLSLPLNIPRGGGTAAAAAEASSKLSHLVSTPTGTFNTVLAVLAASTAGLKLFAKVKSGGATKESGEEAVVSVDHLKNFPPTMRVDA